MMVFIGNDIVDLTDPANIGKSGDDRFLQRVFTEPERKSIARADDPDVMLWALWAAKETAYKIASKINILSVFTPRNYPVVLSPVNHGPTRSGMVHTSEGPVTVRLLIERDYLHCIGATALSGVLDHVLWDIERLSAAGRGGEHDLSAAVRQFAGKRLAVLLHVSEADIDIRRIQDMDKWGPPLPHLEGQCIPFDLSLSHDGAFVAYAMVPVPGTGPPSA